MKRASSSGSCSPAWARAKIAAAFSCVGQLHQLLRTLLDEAAHQRPILVQRGPARGGMLLEGEGNLGAVRDIDLQLGEGSEAKEAQRVIEVRSANCHVSSYAVGASTPAFRAGK
jgi:hypothetical protein